MRKIFILLAITLLTGLTINSYAENNKLYLGQPEIDKVPVSITHNSLFNGAPMPKVRVLTYESTELSTANKFSRYQIQLLDTQGYITRYRTREVDPRNKGFFMPDGTPYIRGNGVGYGGIFMLAYQKWHGLTNKEFDPKDFYKKYLMTSMSDVKGKLFPLAVGNRLSFHYTEISKNKRPGDDAMPDTYDSGTMVYQVISHLKGYKRSFNPVPGDIYVIRVSKTTQEDPRLVPQYEYFFSPYLGWYIAARYYQGGKPVAVYRLVNWQAA